MKFNSYIFRTAPEAHADSMKFTRKGIAYTDPKKIEYYKKLKDVMYVLREDFPTPLEGPCIAIWTFLVARPASIKKSVVPKHTKPDADGFLKAPKDFIQDYPLSKKRKDPVHGVGIVTDDAQIFFEITQKVFVEKGQEATSLIICPLNTKTKTFLWKICPREILQTVLKTACSG